MSLAYPLHPGQTASRTWRRFQKALAITGGALLVACLIYALEKYGLQSRRRFIESPAEVMMRAFGVAHFLLGWLFLFSSPRLRAIGAVARLGGWTLVGALCCGLYGVLGGSRAPLVLLGFYALFMVHEVRDECGLARQSGDVPRDSAFGDALAQAVIALLITLLAGVHFLRGLLLDRASLGDLPLGWLSAGWGVLLAITIALGVRAGVSARRHHGGLNQALDLHAPLVQVYQTLVLVLFLGSLFGSVGLNLVILIHVSVWLVFVTEQLQKQPRSGRGLWHWLRHTPIGFFTAHLALVIILLVLMAVRVHVWERAGWLSQMLSSSSFPYWSLLHICIAFAGKARN